MNPAAEPASPAPAVDFRATLAGTDRTAALAGLFILTLIAFSVALVPIRADNDCWWHVKSGKVIVEQGLPTHDVFSFTAADHEWHNHEWLAQVLMWKVWEAGEATRLGGWRAVILAIGVCVWAFCAILYFLAGRLTRNWWLALLLALLALDFGRRTYYPRPPVMSNVLLAALLLLVVGVYQRWWGRRWLLLIPPAFALWSNLHGAWMAGAVVLVAFVVQDSALHFLRRAPRFAGLPESPVPLWWWYALAPVTVLATFANPSGWRLYELPVRVMGEPQLVERIGELRPPLLQFYPNLLLFLAVFLCALLFVVWSAWRDPRWRPRLPLWAGEWLVFAFFLYQGLSHVRHLLIFAVMMVPLAARVFALALEIGTKKAPAREATPEAHGWSWRPMHGLGCLVACALVGMLLLSNFPERPGYPTRNRQYLALREGYIPHAFPRAPSDFIEFVGFEGRMFNQNSYAGYLIWRFSPDRHLVFSDSRFDIFGAEILVQEDIVSAAFDPGDDETIPHPAWHEVLDRWDVNWMLLRRNVALAEHLASGDEGWALVADWSRYEGSIPWVIFVRDTEENAELIERSRRLFRTLSWNPWRTGP